MPIPYLACMAVVAAFYHLPPRVLPSVQAVEGGINGMVRRDSNGTSDLGIMQVNTIWVQPLSRYTRLSPSEVARDLTTSPCFNIASAGVILRAYLNAAHGELMTAIGDYHSHTPKLNQQYQSEVSGRAIALFDRQAAATGRPRAPRDRPSSAGRACRWPSIPTGRA